MDFSNNLHSSNWASPNSTSKFWNNQGTEIIQEISEIAHCIELHFGNISNSKPIIQPSIYIFLPIYIDMEHIHEKNGWHQYINLW